MHGTVSSPIDGTDILRSVASVSCPFLFPIDISLQLPPELCADTATAVTQYLIFISEHVSFSQSILHLLVEERRIAYAERTNGSATPFCTLSVTESWPPSKFRVTPPRINRETVLPTSRPL
jgi:hypothetical protein